MPDDKNNAPQTLKMRKIPVILGFAAYIFINITGAYGDSSPILPSLAGLLVTAFVYLLLITVFHEMKRLYRKEKKSAKNLYEILAPAFYIIFFTAISIWRITEILTIWPVSYVEYYSCGISNSILLLIFPCISFIYLNLRKDGGTRPGDKTSHGILTLLSYVSVIYAMVIAVNATLKINIFIALQWVYYIISVYLIFALLVNILTSFFKNDVLGDFNYALIPKFPKTGKAENKNSGILDSPEVKERFSLKSLWTLKYALRIFPGLIIFLAFILFWSTTVYVVQPYQQAAVYHFGKLGENSIAGEGLHFKFPWPIDKIDIYDVKRVRSMQIGYEARSSTNNLWNQAHDGGEYVLLLGNGNESVSVNIKLIYKIGDLYSYVKTFTNPELMLSAAAYEIMMNRTVNTTLDSILSVDRSSLSVLITEELSEFCESENLGLTVIQVVIESVHPPVEVSDVYQKVVTASVDKKTITAKAESQAAQELIYAELQSKTTVDYARAEQCRKISDAQKEMAVYYAAMEAYKINPDCFTLTKYLDAYEKVIGGNKIYVFSPGTQADIPRFVIGKNSIVISK